MSQPQVATDSFSFSLATHKFLESTLTLRLPSSNNNSISDFKQRSPSFGSKREVDSAKSWNFLSLLDPSRDSVLSENLRLLKLKSSIAESYKRLKSSFKEMRDLYVASKSYFNVYLRYMDMKHMIKQVLTLDTNYWLLVDIPKQTSADAVADYISKIMNVVEKQQQDKQNEQFLNKSPSKSFYMTSEVSDYLISPRRTSVCDELKTKSSDELKKDIVSLHNEIYVLTTKYLALRDLLAKLKVAYQTWKGQRNIYRYHYLKHLIKDILKAPAFTAICNEVDSF